MLRKAMLLMLGVSVIMTMAPAQERMIPDDPLFNYQVSLENRGGPVTLNRFSSKKSPIDLDLGPGIHLDVTRAWGITTGSKQVLVAIIDDGFFYDHEDIRENIWRNRGEIGLDENGDSKMTNGKDDDGNGYVDDVMGWDFVFDDPDPDGYIFDGRRMDRIQPYSHSTPAMGIIGARGNNGIGISGINWEVSMMLLKCAAQGDTIKHRAGWTAAAIRYAVDNGARLINWSGGVSRMDATQEKEIREAFEYAGSKGALLVCAAGNSRRNIDLEENFIFPACLPNESIMVVGEIDFDGELYVEPEGSKYIGGSNFGEKNVDIAAIAQNYATGQRHNLPIYRIGGGTSDAAPVVTGVAALVLSIRADLTGLQIRQILMKSSVPLPGLKGKVACGGMVSAYRAVSLALEY